MVIFLGLDISLVSGARVIYRHCRVWWKYATWCQLEMNKLSNFAYKLHVKVELITLETRTDYRIVLRVFISYWINLLHLHDTYSDISWGFVFVVHVSYNSIKLYLSYLPCSWVPFLLRRGNFEIPDEFFDSFCSWYGIFLSCSILFLLWKYNIFSFIPRFWANRLLTKRPVNLSNSEWLCNTCQLWSVCYWHKH